MIIPHGAEELGQRLVNFRQWSDLSEGYETQQELLDSCKLNSDGKVDCPAKVTELTAETWVAAAQIYLQCRFFRYITHVILFLLEFSLHRFMIAFFSPLGSLVDCETKTLIGSLDLPK
jgi:hypothetical protein